MNWINRVTDLHKSFLGISPKERGNIFLLGGVLFTLFFSYPMVRVSTTTLLLSSFGAKGSPYAWCFSVIFLVVAVSLFNRAQTKISVQKIYRFTVGATLALFITFFVIYKFVTPFGSYLLYITKEVYIVLLINSVLAFLNISIDKKTAKIVYGPLGAISSIGGICGAFLTSLIAPQAGETFVLFSALLLVASTFFTFNLVSFPNSISPDANSSEMPERISALKAIQSVRSYIICIVGIVVLSQFVINTANYQFNFFLTDYFQDNGSRSAFLGKVYGLVNTCSLLIQIFAIPFILKYVPSVLTHFGIVCAYGLAFLMPLVVGGGSLLGAASTFIIFKGLDYSIFSAAKELLYFSLDEQQKYGAKYLVDMVFYRFSKGLISVILILIPAGYINILLGASLALWGLILIPLFKNYKQLKENKTTSGDSHESITS